MDGQISMNFHPDNQELRIAASLPSIKSGQEAKDMEDTDPLITESINTYNTIIENQLPKHFKSDIHPYYIYSKRQQGYFVVPRILPLRQL